MAYKALYRTYRPRDFDEIAGQEHITKTFKNALENNKLSHAYLFSGPRGTGKTSVAKIIAKAVNCENAPVANPCNSCDICLGIDNNTISDVIEIDAASNNGVDEIREIRDKVKYLPGAGRFKVYIIDEVHMLSTGAFNALLKTLEEPPKHVIFILATTEPHKIPATIHSRCQRFDFRGVNEKEMLARLNEIVEKESLDIEDDALRLIAESSEGGMRDAISLLDQVMSYSKDKIQVDDVHAIRGSITNEAMINVANAIKNEDVVKAMDVLDQLLSEGKESHKFIDDFIMFYRDVLMLKNTGDEHGKMLYKNEAFKALVKVLSNPLVFHYLDILNETKQHMRFASQGKLYLELAFIKMIDDVLKQDVIKNEKIIALNEKIEALEVKFHHLETQLENNFDQEKQAKETQERSVFDDVVHQPKSSETVEDKQSEVQEERSAVQDEQAVKDVVKEEPIKEEPPKDKYALLYDKYAKKRYKTFDVTFVEDVLNTGDREIKIDMVKKWYDIERFVDSERESYAKMITEGTLVATNGSMIIVSYDTATICNRLMKPEVKRKIIEVLEDYYGRKIMFMALPNDVWEQVSREFVKKFRSQDKSLDSFIKLTPIDHPRLVEIPQDEDPLEDVESDSLKEAKDLFGNIVKPKKGD